MKYFSKRSPNKTFVIQSNKKYKYREFNNLMNSVCLLFKTLNLKKGDIISAIIPNSIEYVLLYLSSLRFGTTFNPYPSLLESQDISRHIKKINPSIVFCDEKHYNGLELYKRYVINEEFIKNLMETEEYPDFIPKKKSPACIYSSSGTTGNPKNVIYSHTNIISLVSSIIKGFKFKRNEVHLIVLPLGHTASTNYQFLPCVFGGHTMVITDSFWKIRTNFWKLIKLHKITYAQVVPSVLVGILNTPYKKEDYENISSLKYIGCGSAPLPKGLQIKFKKKYKLPVANLYGLSETGPSHIDYPLEKCWNEGSIGIPLDVNDVKIKNGEIIIKGDNVFVGYYKNQELYNKVVRRGWFYTGDLGYQMGLKFYFTGRKKDLIIKGGSNISPDEIDEVLHKINEIKESATVGTQDKYLGEKISSFIVLKENKKISESKIKDFCRKYLSENKIPNKVFFVESLPKTASGKILKRELKTDRKI